MEDSASASPVTRYWFWPSSGVLICPGGEAAQPHCRSALAPSKQLFPAIASPVPCLGCFFVHLFFSLLFFVPTFTVFGLQVHHAVNFTGSPPWSSASRNECNGDGSRRSKEPRTRCSTSNNRSPIRSGSRSRTACRSQWTSRTSSSGVFE